MKCKSCGKEIQSDFKMCPYCGAAVEPMEEETAFIRLPVEEEQEEDLYEESRKERKARLKREARMREEEEESDIEEDSYDEDDLSEEEEEYYEIPLKKILIIAASVIIVAGLGIGGYFMFFANPLTVTAQTIEAGTAIDDEYLLGLVSLKSNAEGKYTVSVSQNNVDASKTGEYTVTYDLENTSSGKTTSKTVTFKVVDTTAPVITVADSITVPLGGTFNIADYATVTDNADGVISASSISVSGSVDTAKAGTYPITLTVSDAAGNSSSADIKAVVEDSGNPADFMKKILGTWYNKANGYVIAFTSDGAYRLDIGQYQSEGFGTGTLSFSSVNSGLTKATATWSFQSYYEENGSTVYNSAVPTTVTIDTGAAGDDLITVDLGNGDGALDFTFLND